MGVNRVALQPPAENRASGFSASLLNALGIVWLNDIITAGSREKEKKAADADRPDGWLES
jgi:hypothetical protein